MNTSQPGSTPSQAESPAWKGYLVLAAGLFIGASIGIVLLFTIGPGQTWVREWLLEVDPALMPELGAPVPDTQLQVLDARPVSLADLRGKVVLMNFWATWCGPCRSEMPILQDYADRYPDELIVLAINYDETEGQVRDFMEELNIHFPVVLDPGGQVASFYRVRAFPTTYFINRDGIIQFQHIGVLNEGQLAEYLEQMGVGQ